MVLHVGLTYNLAAEIPSGKPDDFYAEYDSSETITSIKKALHTTNRRITLIEADENAYEKLKKQKPAIVFNIAEGKHGESRESHIPSMLEMLGIPYTGSG
ncbi:MAG: D-alanine--D-alanine ligase, partial [Candidatus Altiarchaeota archaeon]